MIIFRNKGHNNDIFEWKYYNDNQHSRNQSNSSNCWNWNKNNSQSSSDYNLKSPITSERRNFQKENRHKNHKFEYQIRNRDDSLDSNDTLDLWRDTEDDLNVQKKVWN